MYIVYIYIIYIYICVCAPRSNGIVCHLFALYAVMLKITCRYTGVDTTAR